MKMKKAMRRSSLVAVVAAFAIWTSQDASPQGKARTFAPLLTWITSSGEVSYSDSMGCYCTNTSAGECSVQYDKNLKRIGACDDTDTTCGDITGCPH